MNNFLISLLNNMKSVKRIEYAKIGITETIDDHAFLATCMAIIICDIYNLPYYRIVPLVTYSDISAISTGDISYTVSEHLKNEYNYKEKAVKEILKEVTSYQQLRNELIFYLQRKSSYTNIIQSINALTTCFEVYQHECSGWKNLDLIWYKNYQKIDESFNGIIKYLKKSRIKNQLKTVYGNNMCIDSYYEGDTYPRVLSEILNRFPNNVYCDLYDDYLKHSSMSCNRVLDIGAGTGRFSEWFRNKKETEVVSIDINSTLLSMIPDQQNDIKMKWNVNDAWPFCNESFDVAVCGEVLEHLFRPDFILSEANRILKMNGQIFISVPDVNHESRKENILKYGHPEPVDKRRPFEEHIQQFNASILLKSLRDSGFKPVSICWYDLATGQKTNFMDIDDFSILPNKSEYRHIFVVGEKVKAITNKEEPDFNVALLFEILKTFEQVKRIPAKMYEKRSITQVYLHEFMKAALEQDEDKQRDSYRLLLIECLKKCYLAGASDDIADDIKLLSRYKENFLGVSKRIRNTYNPLFTGMGD